MDGNTIDILKDNWCDNVLAPHVNLSKVTLRDAILNPNHLVWFHIPLSLAQKVITIQLEQKADMCVWAPNTDGTFTSKSTYNAVIQIKPEGDNRTIFS